MSGAFGVGMMMSIGDEGGRESGCGCDVGRGCGGGAGCEGDVFGGDGVRAGTAVGEIDARAGGTFGDAEARGRGGNSISGGLGVTDAAGDRDGRRWGGGVPPRERGISDAGGGSGVSDSSLITGEKTTAFTGCCPTLRRAQDGWLHPRTSRNEALCLQMNPFGPQRGAHSPNWRRISVTSISGDCPTSRVSASAGGSRIASWLSSMPGFM